MVNFVMDGSSLDAAMVIGGVFMGGTVSETEGSLQFKIGCSYPEESLHGANGF